MNCGRAVQLIGAAHTASEGIVGYDDISLPPLLRVGELVESVPGMAATQYSSTGKANQYFLRGFNLDRGTDFSVALDGMPFNMPTHGQGQGYLDLNPIIPELVREAHYRKGPYAAETGDFASAGSVGFMDPSLGGATDLVALIGNIEAETWSLDLWTSRYDFRPYSNFTYLLDDPDDGDAFEQRDQRSVYGGRLPGKPEGGVEDIHLHPLEPRSLRASLSWHR